MALGRRFGVSAATVQVFMVASGIPRRPVGYPGKGRRHAINEAYFDTIDSEQKAYFLGLLFADGCNSGRAISLKLKIDDVELVSAFRQAIGYSGPITILSPRSNFANAKRQAQCAITSLPLCRRLTELG